MQNVIADDRPEVGLSVVVLKTADRKSRILRILAPLGVLLKDGMELYIDNNNIGCAYFTRCFSEGCYVEVDIDDELLKVLRAGKNAVSRCVNPSIRIVSVFRSSSPALPKATTRFPEASCKETALRLSAPVPKSKER